MIVFKEGFQGSEVMLCSEHLKPWASRRLTVYSNAVWGVILPRYQSLILRGTLFVQTLSFGLTKVQERVVDFANKWKYPLIMFPVKVGDDMWVCCTKVTFNTLSWTIYWLSGHRWIQAVLPYVWDPSVWTCRFEYIESSKPDGLTQGKVMWEAWCTFRNWFICSRSKNFYHSNHSLVDCRCLLPCA